MASFTQQQVDDMTEDICPKIKYLLCGSLQESLAKLNSVRKIIANETANVVNNLTKYY